MALCSFAREAGLTLALFANGESRKGGRGIQWRTVRDIALAWLITLPAAGMLGLLTYLLLSVT
jgi:phosphate/sulfate permease